MCIMSRIPWLAFLSNRPNTSADEDTMTDTPWRWQPSTVWHRAKDDDDSDRERKRKGVAPFSLAGLFCLAVTVGVVIFACKSAPKLSFRKDPSFVQIRTVESTFRSLLTAVSNSHSLGRLLGAAAATVAVSVPVMRTVNATVTAGWLGFIPASGLVLTIAAGAVLALFAAGARLHLLTAPTPHLDMAWNIIFLTFGVICMAVGKLSNW